MKIVRMGAQGWPLAAKFLGAGEPDFKSRRRIKTDPKRIVEGIPLKPRAVQHADKEFHLPGTQPA